MAYRHILVPFDGTPLAQAAQSLAAWLAWRGGGELDIVHALPRTARVPFPLTPNAQARPNVEDLARARTELSALAARLRQEGVTATGSALTGEPVAGMLDYIKRLGIDLVVMGTHGRGLAERWLLGSVASDLGRRCPVPVLLLPREAKPTHDDALRIMVALDGSALAETALGAALELADTVPAEITLFEVVSGAGPSPEEKTPGWYEMPVVGAGGYLEELQSRLAEGGVNVRLAYSAGPAGDEIVLFGDRGHFDVICLGTRGLSGVPRLVWGSVADQVIRQARTPVLVTSNATTSVRPPGSSTRGRLTGERRTREDASAPTVMRYLG